MEFELVEKETLGLGHGLYTFNSRHGSFVPGILSERSASAHGGRRLAVLP